MLKEQRARSINKRFAGDENDFGDESLRFLANASVERASGKIGEMVKRKKKNPKKKERKRKEGKHRGSEIASRREFLTV